MLRVVTSGESHGKCLTGIVEGLPAGLEIDVAFINGELGRRQFGYGRGGRMQIERDELEITSGVRHGLTMGSPVAFIIRNRDWSHWEVPMSSGAVPPESNLRAVSRPRPGHADLAGALKFGFHDARNILERASARETTARVAVGAFAQLLLARFGIRTCSHVLSIGDVRVAPEFEQLDTASIRAIAPDNQVRCADPSAAAQMMAAIDAARKAGDTLGGTIEVAADGIPPGLGSHTQWDRKLDGQLAQALMSIHAVKAVELGDGIAGSARPGSMVHDEIYYDAGSRSFYRKTNRAGGLEGGITNGSEVRARVYLKPIPTLRKPLMSVDLVTKEVFEAAFERSDTCVVPAAGVIAESMTALTIARAFLEKFGGDSVSETGRNFESFVESLRNY
jgi:chorismate synthase